MRAARICATIFGKPSLGTTWLTAPASPEHPFLHPTRAIVGKLQDARLLGTDLTGNRVNQDLLCFRLRCLVGQTAKWCFLLRSHAACPDDRDFGCGVRRLLKKRYDAARTKVCGIRARGL